MVLDDQDGGGASDRPTTRSPEEEFTEDAEPATSPALSFESWPRQGPADQVLVELAPQLLALRDSLHTASDLDPALGDVARGEKGYRKRKQVNEGRRRRRLDLQLLEEQIEDVAMQASTLAQRSAPE